MRVKSLSSSHYQEQYQDVVRRKKKNATDERAAEKIAAEGKKFICKTCRQWYPRRLFEYVYKDETKLATNCEWCRIENRKRYSNPNKGR